MYHKYSSNYRRSTILFSISNFSVLPIGHEFKTLIIYPIASSLAQGSTDPAGRTRSPAPPSEFPRAAMAGASACPEPRSTRRRKTALERRQQSTRSEARRLLWACKAMTLVHNHRGGELGQFGRALQKALQEVLLLADQVPRFL